MPETNKNNEYEKATGLLGFQSLEEFRREHIEHALLTAGNDEAKAAQLLGVPLKALRRCMHRLGMTTGLKKST